MTLAARARSVFADALEFEDSRQRRDYIEQACAGDTVLLERVEELLQAHFEAGSFLEKPVVDRAEAPTLPPEAPVDKPGAIIAGRYKLLQQIGEGGMGVVYMADQIEPVRRRVALKIIKPGMDTEQVSARFEAERQALAMMDHPCIARVLDAGMTGDSESDTDDGNQQVGTSKKRASGRPFFVMELVKGVPITDYCDHNRLTVRERLELFASVCHAIHHAHQKGVIHRDIKPSNILVALFDGKPVPKVIDFGVAKAIQQPLVQQTLFTQYGQIVGTLEYMSPEQAELNQLDVDTRSDIYSLGVVLYELLTGTTPITSAQLREAGFVAMLSLIHDYEPERPSTRVSQSKEAGAKVSQQRKCEPARLSAILRGDLDWIVLKALEKDRSRRYASAADFARDIERYLAGAPVEAAPPSWSYKMRKFVARHRGALATAAAFVVVLSTATVVSVWQAMRAGKMERFAVEGWQAESRSRRQAERAAALERDARRQAESARQQALATACESLFQQARATLLAGQPGRRWEVLRLIERAEKLRKNSDPAAIIAGGEGEPERHLPTQGQLRTTALTALLEPDGRKIEYYSGVGFGLSPNGRYVARLWVDAKLKTGGLQVLDLQSGAIKTNLEGESQLRPIVGALMAVDSEATSIASVTLDHREVVVSSLKTLQPVRHLIIAERGREVPQQVTPLTQVASLTYSPDGRFLVGVRRGRAALTFVLWDLLSDESAPRVIGETTLNATLPSVSFSSDSRYLAFKTTEKEVALYDTEAASVKETIDFGEWRPAGPVDFFPGGDRLAVYCTRVGKSPKELQFGVAICDLAKRKVTTFVPLDVRDWIAKIAIDSSGRYLAAGDIKGRIHIVDFETNRRSVWVDSGGIIQNLAWLPDGRLISGGFGGLKVWELVNSTPLRDVHLEFTTRPQSLMAMLAVSPDGRWFAVGEQGLGSVWLVDAASGEFVRELKHAGEHLFGLVRLQFSPDGRRVALLGYGGVAVWDVASGKELSGLHIDRAKLRDRVTSVGFRSGGDVWVAGRRGRAPAVWSTDTTKTVWQATEKTGYAAVIDDRGNRVATFAEQFTDTDAEVVVRSLPDGTELFRVPQKRRFGMASSVQFSPTSRSLAIFELAGLGPLGPADVPSMATTLAGVDPEGKSSWNGAIYDATTGNHQFSLNGDSNIDQIAFGAQDRYLALALSDGRVQIWDLDAKEHVFDWLVWNEDRAAGAQALPGGKMYLAFTKAGKELVVLDSSGRRLQILDLERVSRELQSIGLAW